MEKGMDWEQWYQQQQQQQQQQQNSNGVGTGEGQGQLQGQLQPISGWVVSVSIAFSSVVESLFEYELHLHNLIRCLPVPITLCIWCYETAYILSI